MHIIYIHYSYLVALPSYSSSVGYRGQQLEVCELQCALQNGHKFGCYEAGPMGPMVYRASKLSNG